MGRRPEVRKARRRQHNYDFYNKPGLSGPWLDPQSWYVRATVGAGMAGGRMGEECEINGEICGWGVEYKTGEIDNGKGKSYFAVMY